MVLIQSVFIFCQLTVLNERLEVSQARPTYIEAEFLRKALSADYKSINIRLREGEYQYDLARMIASFHFELRFPDVKDIIGRLYSEEKAADVQFVRKIQTILKKMEKSNIITILPKKRPWELQRYALLSLKFQDVDKNLVVLASDQQMKQTQSLLYHLPVQQPEAGAIGVRGVLVRIFLLSFVVVASYSAVLWSLMQPIVSAAVFVAAFSLAIVSSIILGKVLAKR
jgi:hypothetical protein